MDSGSWAGLGLVLAARAGWAGVDRCCPDRTWPSRSARRPRLRNRRGSTSSTAASSRVSASTCSASRLAKCRPRDFFVPCYLVGASEGHADVGRRRHPRHRLQRRRRRRSREGRQPPRSRCCRSSPRWATHPPTSRTWHVALPLRSHRQRQRVCRIDLARAAAERDTMFARHSRRRSSSRRTSARSRRRRRRF